MMFNTDFLKHIARMGLDTIYISTGLASYVDILDAMHFLYGMAGKLVVMHCVSLYPCPLDKANLSRIRMLQDFTRCAVGYSDHTIGIGAAVASVAVGARVIEKHFTLDKNFSEGTDHILSVDPLGLRVMCNKVKSMEKMLGTVTSMHDTIEDIPKIEWLKNRFII